jgi:hypothetical protein
LRYGKRLALGSRCGADSFLEVAKLAGCLPVGTAAITSLGQTSQILLNGLLKFDVVFVASTTTFDSYRFFAGLL